jgi:hypothetical protein
MLASINPASPSVSGDGETKPGTTVSVTSSTSENQTGNKAAVEFKIQITASKKKIPSDSPLFSGLQPVTQFEAGGMYKMPSST